MKRNELSLGEMEAISGGIIYLVNFGLFEGPPRNEVVQEHEPSEENTSD